jgi:hypothetical protein
MLQFNAETTRLLENAYHGSDFVKRRLAPRRLSRPRRARPSLMLGAGWGTSPLSYRARWATRARSLASTPVLICERQLKASAVAS